jgi:hypothetical protein
MMEQLVTSQKLYDLGGGWEVLRLGSTDNGSIHSAVNIAVGGTGRVPLTYQLLSLCLDIELWVQPATGSTAA